MAHTYTQKFYYQSHFTIGKEIPKLPPPPQCFTYIEELTGCFINKKCKIIKTQRDVEQEQSDSQEVGSWYKPAIG